MAENKISLSIAGLKLLITTPEDEEDVRKMAEELEENVNDVMTKATSASVTDAMMLCALEYLDSFKKANRAVNNLRTQIKEYMGEAANAKREYDDEHKRVEEMAAEISALRSHLTRLATEGDTSGVLLKLKDEVNTANTELARQRKRCSDLTAQNKALAEKSEAMNSFIAGQDREIARLSTVADELNIRLLDQTRMAGEWAERISWFESQIAELSDEKKRLQNELERMIAEATTQEPQPEIIAVSDDQEVLNTDFDDEEETLAEEADMAGEEEVSAEEPDFAIEEEPLAAEPDFDDEEEISADEPDVADDEPLAAEPDFADAIARVGERRPIERRPIQDYDIDISDLPLRMASPAEELEQQELFAEYKIEEGADALGFENLRKSIEQEEIKKEEITFEVPQPPEDQKFEQFTLLEQQNDEKAEIWPKPEHVDTKQMETPQKDDPADSYRPEHLSAVFENISFEPSLSQPEKQDAPQEAEEPEKKITWFKPAPKETPEEAEKSQAPEAGAEKKSTWFKPPQKETPTENDKPAAKKNSFLTDIIETETRKQGKHRKGEPAEEDDALPNLSWTLDI